MTKLDALTKKNPNIHCYTKNHGLFAGITSNANATITSNAGSTKLVMVQLLCFQCYTDCIIQFRYGSNSTHSNNLSIMEFELKAGEIITPITAENAFTVGALNNSGTRYLGVTFPAGVTSGNGGYLTTSLVEIS
jgi:hypothetical protein